MEIPIYSRVKEALRTTREQYREIYSDLEAQAEGAGYYERKAIRAGDEMFLTVTLPAQFVANLMSRDF